MKYRYLLFFCFSIVSGFSSAICLSPESIKMCAPTVVESAAMTCLECVAYVHPVLAAVGPTIGLAEVAYHAYKKFKESSFVKTTAVWAIAESDGWLAECEAEETLPAEIFLAERYYFEQRKKELTTLRDEFAAIYRGMVTLRELFNPQVATFSSQFLQGVLKCHTAVSLLQIALMDELKLSDERKSALRTAREREFKFLEQEINAFHAALVVHFNGLVMQVELAHAAYREALPNIHDAIAVWNNNRNSITDSIASQAYEQGILEEDLISDIQQKTAELKIIIAYYQQSKNLACLKQSSDIVEKFAVLNQEIIDSEQWISNESVRISNNLHIYEQYFAQRGIPTAGFKNQIKNAFYKDRTNKNNQALKKAKETQSDMSAAGGPNNPKKPEDDDKDDFFKKLKSRSDKKARTSRFGNMFRDPATKLWWSKDLDGHGGSCFKVFKETAKGFEWVFDATKEGVRIVAKHKGPTGLFIPYKEVIF